MFTAILARLILGSWIIVNPQAGAGANATEYASQFACESAMHGGDSKRDEKPTGKSIDAPSADGTRCVEKGYYSLWCITGTMSDDVTSNDCYWSEAKCQKALPKFVKARQPKGASDDDIEDDLDNWTCAEKQSQQE